MNHRFVRIALIALACLSLGSGCAQPTEEALGEDSSALLQKEMCEISQTQTFIHLTSKAAARAAGCENESSAFIGCAQGAAAVCMWFDEINLACAEEAAAFDLCEGSDEDWQFAVDVTALDDGFEAQELKEAQNGEETVH